MDPLRRYWAFYQVARTGSVSRAAAALYVSQPAMSHAIQKLEQEMGFALFVRLPRGMRLTEEGQALYTHLQQAYLWLEKGEEKVRALHRLEDGQVHIGASETLCRYYLLPYMARFHRDHPGVRLHVTNGTSRETVDLLMGGAVDFGLVNLPIGEGRVEVFPGPALHDCFVVGEGRRPPKPLSLSELSQESVIALERGSVSREHVERFFQDQGSVLAPEIELGSLDLVVEFARHGLGVGVVVREFVAELLASGSLSELLTDPPLPARAMGLVVRPGEKLSTAAQAFIQYLEWNAQA